MASVVVFCPPLASAQFRCEEGKLTDCRTKTKIIHSCVMSDYVAHARSTSIRRKTLPLLPHTEWVVGKSTYYVLCEFDQIKRQHEIPYSTRNFASTSSSNYSGPTEMKRMRREISISGKLLKMFPMCTQAHAPMLKLIQVMLRGGWKQVTTIHEMTDKRGWAEASSANQPTMCAHKIWMN